MKDDSFCGRLLLSIFGHDCGVETCFSKFAPRLPTAVRAGKAKFLLKEICLCFLKFG